MSRTAHTYVQMDSFEQIFYHRQLKHWYSTESHNSCHQEWAYIAQSHSPLPVVLILCREPEKVRFWYADNSAIYTDCYCYRHIYRRVKSWTVSVCSGRLFVRIKQNCAAESIVPLLNSRFHERKTEKLLLPLLLPFNGFFPGQSGRTSTRKVEPDEARDDGVLRWQWHQLDHMQRERN